MRLLLVAATEPEIAPLLKELKFCGDISPNLRWYEYKGRNIDVLITGVGMVATAVWVTRVITQRNYSPVINAGIAGSFDRTIQIGEVVRVQTDCLPELGAEDGDNFLDIYELGLSGKSDFPFQNGKLTGSEASPFGSLIQLKPVSAITVNKVHGNENNIAEMIARSNPQIESMEGAAFYYACAVADVTGLQVRAVSNYVEKRNRAGWKLTEAIGNLNAELLKYLNQP